MDSMLFLMQDSETKWMHTATNSMIRQTPISPSIRSTISVVAKLITFATQKNMPLTITEEMPDSYISINAKETKELKPARSTIISPIIRYRFCSMGRVLEAWSKMAAKKPQRFKIPITFGLDMWNLFLRKVPRLLKKAVDRLAASPRRAISFSVSPWPSKITRKSDPQVQLTPTMLPQQTRVTMVSLFSRVQLTTFEIKLPPEELFESLIARMRSLSLQSRRRVRTVDTRPTHAMIALRSLILSWISGMVRAIPFPLVMQLMPQRIQKLMPKTGRKSGIEAAQPF